MPIHPASTLAHRLAAAADFADQRADCAPVYELGARDVDVLTKALREFVGLSTNRTPDQYVARDLLLEITNAHAVQVIRE